MRSAKDISDIIEEDSNVSTHSNNKSNAGGNKDLIGSPCCSISIEQGGEVKFTIDLPSSSSSAHSASFGYSLGQPNPQHQLTHSQSTSPLARRKQSGQLADSGSQTLDLQSAEMTTSFIVNCRCFPSILLESSTRCGGEGCDKEVIVQVRDRNPRQDSPESSPRPSRRGFPPSDLASTRIPMVILPNGRRRQDSTVDGKGDGDSSSLYEGLLGDEYGGEDEDKDSGNGSVIEFSAELQSTPRKKRKEIKIEPDFSASNASLARKSHTAAQ